MFNAVGPFVRPILPNVAAKPKWLIRPKNAMKIELGAPLPWRNALGMSVSGWPLHPVDGGLGR